MWKQLTIPGAIVAGCALLALSFYFVQVDKRESIEKQQVQENVRAAMELQQSQLKSKQDECASLSSGLKQRWNNVIGVTYDNDLWKECVVTYTDTKTGEVKTSPLRLMQTAD